MHCPTLTKRCSCSPAVLQKKPKSRRYEDRTSAGIGRNDYGTLFCVGGNNNNRITVKLTSLFNGQKQHPGILCRHKH